MKAKFAGIVSAVLALCILCSVSALAVSTDEQTTGMTVTYTKQESGGGGSDPEPNRPAYVISIPSEMSLNSGDTLPIYLKENNLTGTQKLNVFIDTVSTLEDDLFLHLNGTKGQTPAKVSVGYYNAWGNVEYIDFNTGTCQVAQFESGNNHPVWCGTLYFNLENESELIADTYTGTVHFLMSVDSE